MYVKCAANAIVFKGVKVGIHVQDNVGHYHKIASGLFRTLMQSRFVNISRNDFIMQKEKDHGLIET